VPYTGWGDVFSPWLPGFDVTRLLPLIPIEIQEMMGAVAVPYDPTDETRYRGIIRWADPHDHMLEVTLQKPYLKITEPELNQFGLPNKEFYTTGDLCKFLDLRQDTFTYRLPAGIYSEANKHLGDNRRFTYDEVAKIIEITKAMPKQKYKPRRK
jgi:hypothetical protein